MHVCLPSYYVIVPGDYRGPAITIIHPLYCTLTFNLTIAILYSLYVITCGFNALHGQHNELSLCVYTVYTHKPELKDMLLSPWPSSIMLTVLM